MGQSINQSIMQLVTRHNEKNHRQDIIAILILPLKKYDCIV